MEEIMAITAYIASIVYYLWLIFGYDQTANDLRRFSLCKYHNGDSTPRPIRFFVGFIVLPFISFVCGFVLPPVVGMMVILSPIILVYFIVTYFIDKHTKIC